MKLDQIIAQTDAYNFHAHTQFCDGRDTMEQIARAACREGFGYFAFSPHSPVPVESPCNMDMDKTSGYLAECNRLKEIYAGQMEVLASMEIDYLSPEWGPHIDWFGRLPLDFRLGSVHFVPTREGVPVDCDGRFENFKRNLDTVFGGDLRYVVEKYYEQVLKMLERGGVDLLGHFDKIAGNASLACPGLEEEGWYCSLVDDVISHAVASGVIVEINTKAYADRGRFFPDVRWWPRLLKSGLKLAVDSDAHYSTTTTAGRREALDRLSVVRKLTCLPSESE